MQCCFGFEKARSVNIVQKSGELMRRGSSGGGFIANGRCLRFRHLLAIRPEIVSCPTIIGGACREGRCRTKRRSPRGSLYLPGPIFAAAKALWVLTYNCLCSGHFCRGRLRGYMATPCALPSVVRGNSSPLRMLQVRILPPRPTTVWDNLRGIFARPWLFVVRRLCLF